MVPVGKEELPRLIVTTLLLNFRVSPSGWQILEMLICSLPLSIDDFLRVCRQAGTHQIGV